MRREEAKEHSWSIILRAAQTSSIPSTILSDGASPGISKAERKEYRQITQSDLADGLHGYLCARVIGECVVGAGLAHRWQAMGWARMLRPVGCIRDIAAGLGAPQTLNGRPNLRGWNRGRCCVLIPGISLSPSAKTDGLIIYLRLAANYDEYEDTL